LDACVRLPIQHQSDCIAEASNAARENERQEQDLVAQRVTAVWTFLMGCAAIVGMGLSIVGVFLVWTTFRAAREANEIGRNALIAERRPWLEIEKVMIGGIQMEAARAVVDIVVIGKNVGNSPAQNINLNVRLDTSEIAHASTHMRKYADLFRRNGQVNGTTCFPTKCFTLECKLSNGFEIIDRELAEKDAQVAKSLRQAIGGEAENIVRVTKETRKFFSGFVLFGSVTYQMTGFEQVYQTTFAVNIRPMAGSFPRANQSYLPTDLSVEQDRWGTIAE